MKIVDEESRSRGVQLEMLEAVLHLYEGMAKKAMRMMAVRP